MQEVKLSWRHSQNMTKHFQVSKESPETVKQVGRASQDGTFHTSTARLLHGTVCYRYEAKIPNTIQNQATRRYKNFIETLLFNTRELQQGIARWTDTYCGIHENTTIAGTYTG